MAADSTLLITRSTLALAIQEALSENAHDADTLSQELFDRCMKIERERVRTEKCPICGDPVVENSRYCMRHEDI